MHLMGLCGFYPGALVSKNPKTFMFKLIVYCILATNSISYYSGTVTLTGLKTSGLPKKLDDQKMP